MKHRIIASCLAVIIFCFCFTPFVNAYDVEEMNKKGVVTTDTTPLNIRSGPGTNYEVKGTASSGSMLDVLGKTTGEDKYVWYKVSANGISGFVRSTYIRLIDIPEDEDEEFELSISQFPESYKRLLRNAHALHPTWKFTPLITDISWDELLENQYVTGRNLLKTPVSWRSYEKGAYDWTNNTWYNNFDSGGWIQACEECIDYYLDPRNFIENGIFQFLVLSYDGTEVPVSSIKNMLKNTFMYEGDVGGGMTYPEAIIAAGKEAGASPYMLAARIRLEQGAVGNKLAHGTVTETYNGESVYGYYNHFDIGAYAHNGRGAILNGAIYAKNKGWDTPYKAIVGGATFLVKSYIGVGQNTLYLQKYDVVDGGNGYYGHQYMTNVDAAYTEGITLQNAIIGSEAENTALNFLIPVYKNMPEEVAPKPLTTGSANNLLSDISAEDVIFTEKFDKYTKQYEGNTSRKTIEITAKAYDEAAVISGTGTVELEKGVNEIRISVLATNGCTRTYTLYITYDGPDPISKTYGIGDTMIMGIAPLTTVEGFKENLILTERTAIIKGTDGNEKANSDMVKTGDILFVTEGEITTSYSIVIYGDTNGDGKLTSADLLRTQRVILKLAEFDNKAFENAADFNRDGNINSRDLLTCQRRILGLS